MVTAAAVAGSVLGGRLVSLVRPEHLRKAFGWFVLVMAGVILAQETTLVVGLVELALVAVAAAVLFLRHREAPARERERHLT
jgi:uncharacterized membrane protein YfcA